MFEDMTYEYILEDMLNRITSDVDKREGSVIYDALAPCAYQLAQAYFYLNSFIDLTFGDTAVGEYLDRVAADYGLTRKAATQAVRKVVTTGEVALETRWAINGITYEITKKIADNMYKAVCSEFGEMGNTYTGALENIDNVSGVTAALEDIISEGQDEETDENLRERYYTKVRLPSTSGNANHYRQWALEVSGVGDAKIFPLWKGPGTVKVVIVDNDKKPAGTLLLADAAQYIELVRPVGAKVTVVSGQAKAINISAALTLASGYSLQAVISSFMEAMTNYFHSIAFTQSYVSLAKLGTLLLGTVGVADYSDLKLNGSGANIALADEEIPSLGAVELEV